jgi:hypothetical protein
MEPTPGPNAAGFVTVVGWVCVVLGILGTFVAAVQNLMFQVDLPITPPDGWIGWVFRGVFLLFLAVNLALLVSAIGVVRRRGWARWTLMTTLCVIGLWTLLGGVGSGVAAVVAEPAEQFERFARALQVAMAGFGLAVGVVCAWLVRRLGSADVREVFARPR